MPDNDPITVPTAPPVALGEVVYQGWFKRRGGRWQIVADGPSHDVALSRLLDYLAAHRISGDSMVLPADAHPNDRPGRGLRYRRGRDFTLLDLLPVEARIARRA